MKLSSQDGTLSLTIGTPGTGFALAVDGHLWLFDAQGNVTGSILPRSLHQTADGPDHCPGCARLVVRNYGSFPQEGEEPK